MKIGKLFASIMIVALMLSMLFVTQAAEAAPAEEILLTEIVVTPTGGEFVEIYNPTGSAIDLSDFYLTDATFAGGGTYYYNIVTGSNAGGGGFSDFLARFPDGASIGAGEYQTIALAGSDDFFSEYSANPTYELFEDGSSSDAIPNMREGLPGSINGQGGLTNSGEVVVLFYWDGQSDLVTDVDYALWGDKDEAVDKTGVAIDGPDVDSDTSSYQADTAITSQDILASGSHFSGNSWQREDLTEGTEVTSGGNGVNSEDETSEDLSNTWCEAVPTPGAATVCAPPPPPPSTDWIINEINADPDSTDGDANRDGTAQFSDDEFVEIVNNTGGDVNISGWTLSDGFGVRHTFPYGTVLSDQCAVVVFGGGTPAEPFGNSLVQTASSGALGLNNGGDSVALNDGTTDVASSSYGGEGGDNQSLTLDPDITGSAYVKHTLATGSGGALFSPGTMIDGTPFAECPEFDPVQTIGEIQGVVNDSDSGTSHSSPFVGSEVYVQGVVFERTQEYRSDGGAYYGFFMQNTAAEADGDPNSSDGIFVFQYIYSTLLVDGGGFYEPQIGDEVVIRGTVEERYGNTRLNFVNLVEVVRSGVDLDVEIPAFVADPPHTYVSNTDFDDIQDAYRYWERREGMRGQVPAGSIVLNGRDVFASSFDSEVWVVRSDTIIGQRTDPYEQRSFRDVHPFDDITSLSFDNDNPYRILMGGFGVKATADDTTTLLPPARTFDTLTNAPIGGVYYNFGKYSIQVEEQPTFVNGVDPSLNNPPTVPDPDFEYSVVVFNVENLYDYVDDAFDGCDFQGNDGCPGVYPPFDYAPPNNDVYQTRLSEIASQIINDLHSPDIILTQEVEDQDVCLIVAGAYTCPAFDDQENNADGKPDALQELAQVIHDMGGPMYDAALDRDGADDRGIVSGYLYRTDRVELLPAMADHPVLGDDPQVYYPDGDALPYNTDVQNPKVFNAILPDYVTGDTDGDNVFTRPPQVALFRIWRDSVGMSVFQDVYISNNHFSSGPDRRVDQRTEQAAYNAAIVEALQEINSYVSVGGDLNVYPRPDDPFPTPNESDQLKALYEVPLTNLWNLMVNEYPVSAYSYIYQGQSQTLDQLFTSQTWLAELTQARMTHINADFPADYPGDGPRGTSDHDPVFSAYNLLPTLNRLEELVWYYDANGMIIGNNTTRALLDHLDKAARYEARDNHSAYLAQLQAFQNQVQGKAPRFIPQDVADVLANEAALMMSLP
jgi:hypothetical protein